MFENILPAPPDAILGLTEAFKNDSSPEKINLGVGVYKDAQGKTPVLNAVKQAEEHLLATEVTKGYLPITGNPAYGEIVRTQLFGEESSVIAEGRACTAHTPGGTGALRVGGDFIKKQHPDAKLWLSNPTWANHRGVFTAAGLELATYRYYDAATHDVDFAGLLEDLARVPAGDVVLMHVCCHNPTGVDLSPEQWVQVRDLSAEKGWTPFFDFAYQGLGVGILEDRAALKPFADAGHEFFVASSFSKNFGLYNERVGAITLVAETQKAALAAFSHLKLAIRTNYSNPSNHGGGIVITVMRDAELRATWEQELTLMRERIRGMRADFVDGLTSRGVTQDFSFIKAQCGMFSFSGLGDEQVNTLREKNSIYIVKGGRINVAGITPGNIDYLCDAVTAVL